MFTFRGMGCCNFTQIYLSHLFATFAATNWPLGLMDRISDSDSEDTGSIPVEATTEHKTKKRMARQ